MRALVNVALFVLGIILHVVFLAFLYRQKKGRFQVVQNSSRRFHFISDFGDITIDGIGHRVLIEFRKKKSTILFDQIQRLDYGMKTDEASIFEDLWNGLSVGDLIGTYRDVNQWFYISLVLINEAKVPLYIIGQYEPREFWSGWVLALGKANTS